MYVPTHTILIHDSIIMVCFSHAVGEVEEAFSMSPGDFEISYGVDKPPTDNPNIVFTCLSGTRSLVALEFVHQLGYSRLVTN